MKIMKKMKKLKFYTFKDKGHSFTIKSAASSQLVIKFTIIYNLQFTSFHDIQLNLKLITI